MKGKSLTGWQSKTAAASSGSDHDGGEQGRCDKAAVPLRTQRRCGVDFDLVIL